MGKKEQRERARQRRNAARSADPSSFSSTPATGADPDPAAAAPTSDPSSSYSTHVTGADPKPAAAPISGTSSTPATEAEPDPAGTPISDTSSAPATGADPDPAGGDIRHLLSSFRFPQVPKISRRKKELSGKQEALLSTCSSSAYIIEVCYEQMCEFGDIDLIVRACNSQDCLEDGLLPAARQFLRERGFGDEAIRNETCLSFSGFPMRLDGFPASMQKLEDLLKGDLVEYVSVLPAKLSILVPTSRGRLLIPTLMDALWECHLNRITWDGTFGIAELVAIDYGSDVKRVKIIKKPLEADRCMERMSEAMVRDLQNVAKLIIPSYKTQDGALPVYFSQLKEDLDGATNALVLEAWFREYLSYHVAFMPSTARRCLEIMLYDTYNNCTSDRPPCLLAKPAVHVNDWRNKLKKFDKNEISALWRVYSYHGSAYQVETDRYENSVRGLMKFKRNFLAHGGQSPVSVRYLAELELCAADMYSEFLPSLLRTLLEQELTKTYFGEAWTGFKASRSAKSDSWSS